MWIWCLRYSSCQEHGDLINLHDWYQSFKRILLCPNSKKRHKLKQSPVSKKQKFVDNSEKLSEAAIQYPLCLFSEYVSLSNLLFLIVKYSNMTLALHVWQVYELFLPLILNFITISVLIDISLQHSLCFMGHLVVSDDTWYLLLEQLVVMHPYQTSSPFFLPKYLSKDEAEGKLETPAVSMMTFSYLVRIGSWNSSVMPRRDLLFLDLFESNLTTEALFFGSF